MKLVVSGCICIVEGLCNEDVIVLMVVSDLMLFYDDLNLFVLE